MLIGKINIFSLFTLLRLLVHDLYLCGPWPSMQHEHVEGEAPLGLLALELKPAPGPGPLHDHVRTLARCGPEAAVSSAAQ